MVFAGLGLGMGMPILNLAVQNEFEQKDLGAATASVQLFRGLGSTVGTAVMSGLLTAGILSSFGDVNQSPYLQQLKQSPAAAAVIDGEVTADKLLMINSRSTEINDQAASGLSKAKLPPIVQDQQLALLEANQTEYSTKLIQGFTDSLHQIFLISGILMAAATVVVLQVKERPLRSA